MKELQDNSKFAKESAQKFSSLKNMIIPKLYLV